MTPQAIGDPNMSKTTFRSYVRSKGGSDVGTPGVLPILIKCSVDPTDTTAAGVPMVTAEGAAAIIPVGGIPLSVTSLGGAIGGTNPTINVGNGTDADGFAVNLDADGYSHRAVTGALLGITLTADTGIYGKVGGSAAASGTTTILVEYLPSDTGAV